MNPGPVEEVGKVAGGFIDSLKSQPLSLALVVMNLALLGMLFYAAQLVSEQRKREIAMIYEDQKSIRDLLAKCVIPHKEEAS